MGPGEPLAGGRGVGEGGGEEEVPGILPRLTVMIMTAITVMASYRNGNNDKKNGNRII